MSKMLFLRHENSYTHLFLMYDKLSTTFSYFLFSREFITVEIDVELNDEMLFFFSFSEHMSQVTVVRACELSK